MVLQVIIESPAQFGIRKKLANGIANGFPSGVRKAASNKLLTNGDSVSNGVDHHHGSVHGETNGALAHGDHLDVTAVNGVNGTQKHPAPSLLVFSAYSPDSLERQISAYRDFVETQDNNTVLKDLAYTLTSRRNHRPYRAYAIIDGTSGFQEASSAVNTAVDEGPPRVGWIFTGQGAQWAEMGVKLIDTNFVFRTKVQAMDKYLQTLELESPIRIEGKKCGARCSAIQYM